MRKEEFIQLLERNPVVAAVKDEEGLERALASDSRVVFTLFGDVLNIADMAKRIRESGRAAMVHIDLIDGLSTRDIAVDFIAKNTAADGILTTKLNLAKRAHERGLLCVQRFFLLDSMSLANLRRQFPKDCACAIELLPGLMPKVISQVSKSSSLPVIAGGLIRDKEDVVSALGAGACAVSTTNPELWNL